jgi:DNA-binding response OmpR family regulator
MRSEKASALIVDDDRALGEVMAIALAREGVDCETVLNAAQAAMCFARRQFDVVILDLRLPGKNGHTLAIEMCEQSDRPVVVVLTGCHDPRMAKDLLKRGVDDVMFKPVDYPLFAAKIRALLDRRALNVPAREVKVERKSSIMQLNAIQAMIEIPHQKQLDEVHLKAWDLVWGRQ